MVENKHLIWSDIWNNEALLCFGGFDAVRILDGIVRYAECASALKICGIWWW